MYKYRRDVIEVESTDVCYVRKRIDEKSWRVLLGIEGKQWGILMGLFKVMGLKSKLFTLANAAGRPSKKE